MFIVGTVHFANYIFEKIQVDFSRKITFVKALIFRIASGFFPIVGEKFVESICKGEPTPQLPLDIVILLYLYLTPDFPPSPPFASLIK